jgi:hypothetical protein
VNDANQPSAIIPRKIIGRHIGAAPVAPAEGFGAKTRTAWQKMFSLSKTIVYFHKQ